MLKNYAAAVLVLDMEMQQCGGPELAAVLHDEQLAEEIQIIFLTSESELIKKLHAINGSNENFLSRMAVPGQLLAMINRRAQRYRTNMKQMETLRAARYELGSGLRYDPGGAPHSRQSRNRSLYQLLARRIFRQR
jgi:FixJ family two-component response regulator